MPRNATKIALKAIFYMRPISTSSPPSKRPIKWLKMRLKRIPHEYAWQGMGRGLQFSTPTHFAQ